MPSKITHAEHCCLEHGCKYGDPNCPVFSGEVEQKYPCSWCEDGEGFVWGLFFMDSECNYSLQDIFSNRFNALKRARALMAKQFNNFPTGDKPVEYPILTGQFKGDVRLESPKGFPHFSIDVQKLYIK